MVLSDKRFGAELVAKRLYKFDGIDELARFQEAHPEIKGETYVTDGETGNLVPARQAFFIASPDLHGPMGGHVMAFAKRQDGEEFAARHRLQGVRWLDLDRALAEPGGGSDAGR